MISINAHRLTETIESIQKAFLIMNWGSNVFLKNHKRFLKRVRWSAEKPSSPTLTPAPVEAARDPALHLEMRGGPSRTSGKGERLKQEVAAEGEVRPLPWRHWSFWSQKKGAPWDSKIMYLEIEKKTHIKINKDWVRGGSWCSHIVYKITQNPTVTLRTGLLHEALSNSPSGLLSVPNPHRTSTCV